MHLYICMSHSFHLHICQDLVRIIYNHIIYTLSRLDFCIQLNLKLLPPLKRIFNYFFVTSSSFSIYQQDSYRRTATITENGNIRLDRNLLYN